MQMHFHTTALILAIMDDRVKSESCCFVFQSKDWLGQALDLDEMITELPVMLHLLLRGCCPSLYRLVMTSNRFQALSAVFMIS